MCLCVCVGQALQSPYASYNNYAIKNTGALLTLQLDVTRYHMNLWCDPSQEACERLSKPSECVFFHFCKSACIIIFVNLWVVGAKKQKCAESQICSTYNGNLGHCSWGIWAGNDVAAMSWVLSGYVFFYKTHWWKAAKATSVFMLVVKS